jgi:hypothetical protein
MLARSGVNGVMSPSGEKFVLIRPEADVYDALVRAARGRHMRKNEFIEKLLGVLIHDQLIDAVLDDHKGRLEET